MFRDFAQLKNNENKKDNTTIQWQAKFIKINMLRINIQHIVAWNVWPNSKNLNF